MNIGLYGYDYYGLPVLSINEQDYILAETESAATEACKRNLEEMYWAFTNTYIKSHLKDEFKLLSDSTVTAILYAIAEECEEGNLFIKAIIKDPDKFIEEAINTDGRGHFLSNYDGKELSYLDLYGEEFVGEDFAEVTNYIKELTNIETESTDWLFYKT
jgi:hypothetical protein